MKSEIIENKEEDNKPVFPCLRRSSSTGIVVMFYDTTKGVVLVTTNASTRPVGYVEKDFTRYDHPSWQVITNITIKFEM